MRFVRILIPARQLLLILSDYRIGIAYAGTHREDIRELLLPAIGDTAVSMEVAAMTALALGFIFVGSCDGEVAMTILQTMMEREEAELKSKYGRFLSLGLALLFLGEWARGLGLPWRMLTSFPWCAWCRPTRRLGRDD